MLPTVLTINDHRYNWYVRIKYLKLDLSGILNSESSLEYTTFRISSFTQLRKPYELLDSQMERRLKTVESTKRDWERTTIDQIHPRTS